MKERKIIGWDKIKGIYHALDLNHVNTGINTVRVRGRTVSYDVVWCVCGKFGSKYKEVEKYMMQYPPSEEMCPDCVKLLGL